MQRPARAPGLKIETRASRIPLREEEFRSAS